MKIKRLVVLVLAVLLVAGLSMAQGPKKDIGNKVPLPAGADDKNAPQLKGGSNDKQGPPTTLSIDDVVGPAAGFINSLRADDWAALVAFDIRPEILTDFTKNKSELYNGLRRMQ